MKEKTKRLKKIKINKIEPDELRDYINSLINYYNNFNNEKFDDTKNTDYLNKIRQCAINYYKESIDNNDIKSWNNELGEMWSDYKNTYNNIVKKRKFILN